MLKRFIITADHGHGPVYLCWGGGTFTWWTIHRSMASRLTQEASKALLVKHKGQVIGVEA
jgi:hypothetical protein